VSNSTEKQVATTIEHIEQLGKQLYLSEKVRLQVAEVYAEAACDNLTDGRPSLLTAAAALCIGTREAENPRPSERVAKAADLESSRLKHTIRKFQEELDRGFCDLSSASYVPFLCKDLEFNEEIIEQASHLIREYEACNRVSGTHPVGIAAAAIYQVSDGDVTQREMATVAGVSKETIRVRLNDLRGLEEV
jgi:transcription initiation factor TFIIB